MATAGPSLQLPNNRATMTVDISTAADGLSDAISLKGHALAAIQPSTAWTAGAISFVGSLDGTNYYDVKTSTGGELSVIVSTAGATLITLTQDERNRLAPFDKLKIRSGVSSAAVAQGAVRTLTLGLIPLQV